jgi:hypothetical protein
MNWRFLPIDDPKSKRSFVMIPEGGNYFEMPGVYQKIRKSSNKGKIKPIKSNSIKQSKLDTSRIIYIITALYLLQKPYRYSKINYFTASL